jgi:hypothetical protein
MKVSLKAFYRSISSIPHKVKCYFLPHNVVKVTNLARTWNDRDALMFHAIFQILVDFVELEQPFRLWSEERYTGRFTDIRYMNEYIEKWFSADDVDPEEQQQVKEHYNINKEIMYLYEWYKGKKFEFDDLKYHNMTGEKFVVNEETLQIETVANGLPKLITWDEVFQIEQEHNIVCNAMLRRVLAVREYLWT